MFCEKCGNKVEKTDKVCSKCGANLLKTDSDKVISGSHIEGKFDIRYDALFYTPLTMIICYVFLFGTFKLIQSLNIYDSDFLLMLFKYVCAASLVIIEIFILTGKQYIIVDGDTIKCKGAMVGSKEISCNISDIKFTTKPLVIDIPGRLNIIKGTNGTALVGLTNRQEIVDYLQERIKK